MSDSNHGKPSEDEALPGYIPADYFDKFPLQAPLAYRNMIRQQKKLPTGKKIDRTVG
jgi:hypothetical protein